MITHMHHSHAHKRVFMRVVVMAGTCTQANNRHLPPMCAHTHAPCLHRQRGTKMGMPSCIPWWHTHTHRIVPAQTKGLKSGSTVMVCMMARARARTHTHTLHRACT